MADDRLTETIEERHDSEDEDNTEHGTSTEYVDPWCDLCYDKISEMVKPCGFCSECNTFICKSCYENHRMWPVLRNHKILREGKMPKSQADKPVKYINCDAHNENMKDHYCLDHHLMVCKDCTKQTHARCSSVSLSAVCQDLESEDIQQFLTVVDGLKQDILSLKLALMSNASDIEIQKEHLIKQAEKQRDDIIAKAEKIFLETSSMISYVCDQNRSRIADQILTLDSFVSCDDEIICDISKTLKLRLDQNVFIQIQHIVENVKERNTEVEEMIKQLNTISLSFSSTADVSAFLSNCKYLGDVKELLTPFKDIRAPQEIVFPQTERLKLKQVSRKTSDISKISAKKINSFSIRIDQDNETCCTIGMAVKSDSTLIVVDETNQTVKVFSENGKLTGSLAFTDKPGGVEIVNDMTAVVAGEKNNYILDISDITSITVIRHVNLNCTHIGVARHGDDLVATSWGEPKCAVLMNLNGKELWSVSADSSGQSLFARPRSVAINNSNGATRIIVTDWGKNTLTVLDPAKGDIIATKYFKDKNPHGITTDNNGNLYICYHSRQEIGVLSPDLQETRILLSGEELQEWPIDIAYCSKTETLYISYLNNDTVDCFKLFYGYL